MGLSFSDALKEKFAELHPGEDPRPAGEPFSDLNRPTEPFEVKSFDRSKAKIVADRGGCRGVSIIEHEGDTFRIEERAERGPYIVATSRNNRVFRCRTCGSLDAVDRCRLCDSTDIVIYVEQNIARTSVLRSLASALKKVTPALCYSIVEAFRFYNSMSDAEHSDFPDILNEQ